MAYSPGYDWDEFKFDHIGNIATIITQIWNAYEKLDQIIPPEWRLQIHEIATLHH